jgi:hypothetical protein
LVLLGCKEPLEVVFDGDKEPSRAQIGAVEEFVSNWPALRSALKRPLFAYYRSTLAAATDVEPTNAREEDIWSYASVHEIRCPTQTPGGNRYIRIGGSCSWEEEHGLEIHVRDGTEIIYLGSYHGDVSMEPPEEAWWNFAIPENQEAALAAEDPLTDEEIAELAVNAPNSVQDLSSMRGAQVETRRTKPWWKLW